MTDKATLDLAAFERYAAQTVAAFPQPLRDAASSVILQVAEWPDTQILQGLEIDNPLELTGLYIGIPLTEKSFADPQTSPDMVWLFREPILAEWRAREDVTLEALISHVTVHEFAHHFGWSDDDIATIDRWWE